MDLGLWIARSVAATILGILVFVSFLSFMLVNHFTGKALDDQFYTEILIEHDAYNRVYDQVLLDDEVRQSTRELTRNLRVVSHEELVGLAKEVAPPEYVQGQVEENIAQATGYLNGEENPLDLRVELGPPLDQVKPVLFADIDRRIDALDTVEPDPNFSLQEQMAQAQEVTESSLQSLAAGRMPEAVPSIRLIPEASRAAIFDILLPNVLNESSLDTRVRAGLGSSAEDLRREFIAGDTRQFLKVAARAILAPVADDSLARLRQNLDSQDRLDVIRTLARHNNNATEASIRADIADLRDRISRAQTWGKTVALVVGIVATVAMVLLYLPTVSNALRWPGLTLLLTGVVLYTLGRVLENTLPERVNSLIDSNVSRMSGLPPSAVDLIAELLKSAGQRMVEGLAAPMLLLIILGAVLFGASFLVPLLRRYVPGIR